MHHVIYLLVPGIFIAVDAVVDAASAVSADVVVVVIVVITGVADWVLRRRLLRRGDAQPHVVSSVLQFLDPKHQNVSDEEKFGERKKCNVIYLDSFE